MSRWRCRLLALVFTAVALAACQKQAHFNPALAGRFFPLQVGSTWTYEVVYPNGARETISDRVVRDPGGTSLEGTLVVSDYSGLDGSRSVRAELPQSYPAERTEVETRYIVMNGYITRIENLGGASGIRFEERDFLPRYLWPDRNWSTSLVPFEPIPGTILTLTQTHRTFLERHKVAVPAGHFSGCIRIETEVSYHVAGQADHKRYFTDWYAADVGLIKTVVRTDRQNGREMARIQLMRVAKSETATPLQSANRPSIVPLSSKIATSSIVGRIGKSQMRSRLGQ
jgi:hypothetical protein